MLLSQLTMREMRVAHFWEAWPILNLRSRSQIVHMRRRVVPGVRRRRHSVDERRNVVVVDISVHDGADEKEDATRRIKTVIAGFAKSGGGKISGHRRILTMLINLSGAIYFLHLTMPRSKRSKVTTLSKTPIRATKASKAALVTNLRNSIDEYDHIWVFSVGDMRNEGLKQVRGQWRGSGRFFFGKGKVMAKALGETPETEHQEGLHHLAKVGCAVTPLTTASPWSSRHLPHLHSSGRDH